MSFSFQNARIPVKLAGASLAFALPIAVLTYFTLQGLNKDINFTELELAGNAYLRPLVSLLADLPEAGKSASRVDEDFAGLAKLQALHGAELQFTPADLAKRGREAYHPDKVAQAWRNAAKTPPEALDPLTADVRGMIAHAGDTSNLILDPDLDSYYLMDVVLLALPQTLDRTAKALRDALPMTGGSALSLAERSTLAVYTAMLRESDLERVLADLGTALKEDENFYGVSPTLQSQVPPKREAYDKANKALLQAMEKMNRGGRVTREELAELGGKAMRADMELWETCSRELDVLLHKRVAHYQRNAYLALGLSLLAVLAACAGVALIGRGIVRQLASLRAYADKVAHGQLDAPLPRNCRAEFAELSEDIQDMVRELRKRLGFNQGLMRAFKVPLLVADAECKVTYTNQELLDFIEVEGSPEAWTGLTVAALVRNDPAKPTIMSDCLRDRRSAHKAEIDFTTRRGNIRHALVDSELLHDLDGNIIGVCGVLTDITDIRRHESELEKRNNALALAASTSQGIVEGLGQAMRRLSECIGQAAEGASLQNERASETVAAVAAMNGSAQQMADLAGEAAQSADTARGTAQEGEAMVRTAVQSIATVQGQVLDLQQRMRELGAQAENVGKVLQVIGDIADQTNLLALNAAIEAARAGDAGRGFAVVADEVRKLAEKTMQATHEVGSTLDAIRSGAAGTLSATEKAAREIVETTELAQSSGDHLGRIVSIVQGASEQARAIAQAAEDQARASRQASQAVAEIEDVSSRTAHGMAEASQALEEVDNQAASLEELIRGMGR